MTALSVVQAVGVITDTEAAILDVLTGAGPLPIYAIAERLSRAVDLVEDRLHALSRRGLVTWQHTPGPGGVVVWKRA